MTDLSKFQINARGNLEHKPRMTVIDVLAALYSAVLAVIAIVTLIR
jgi:hypothetical protein